MRERIMSIVAGSVLMCLALPASIHAQGAYTIPKSDRTISGELTFPGDCSVPSPEQPGKRVKVPCKARFTVQDGTWVTVENRKAGFFYGFLGQINEATKKPNFIPYELTRRTPDETDVMELDKTINSTTEQDSQRDIVVGEKKIFKFEQVDKAGHEVERQFTLLVTGRATSIFAAPYISDTSLYREEDLEKEFGYSASNNCCMTCQGATVCASSVSTSCGDCSGGGRGWTI